MYPAENALQSQDLEQRMQEMKQRVDRINRQVLAFVKERPGTCLVGAIVLGFVVGRIAARA